MWIVITIAVLFYVLIFAICHAAGAAERDLEREGEFHGASHP